MQAISDWWHSTTKEEKFIQFVVFFFAFGYSSIISGSFLGIPMGLACLYIVYDCVKKRSLAGFYMPAKCWLGLALFLGAVVLSSLFLGDRPSIRMAWQYVYWALPFPILFYLGRQADIKYAALLGVMVSLAVTSANMAYMEHLLTQGKKLDTVLHGGRIGAFDRHPNIHALLLIGILPILLCSFKDKKLRSHTGFLALQLLVAAAGLWSLWKTGSRGAMLGLAAGAVFVYLITYHCKKIWKAMVCLILAGGAMFAGYAFGDFSPGNHGYDDTTRLRMLSSSYAMWKDHKLLGVGLANWRKQYIAKYMDKKAIKEAARQYYLSLREADKRKLSPKEEKAREAAIQKVAFQEESSFHMPHNGVAWFFATTGFLGGMGYILFLVWSLYVLAQMAKEHPDYWLLAGGLWLFLAMGIHGMVDAGITYKGAARLLYLQLGLALGYGCGIHRAEHL